jgi:hypothetical protein
MQLQNKKKVRQTEGWGIEDKMNAQRMVNSERAGAIQHRQIFF